VRGCDLTGLAVNPSPGRFASTLSLWERVCARAT
jgi:hypothetical protein